MSLLRIIPLIGALLLSAAPAQASRTPKQILEACEDSNENYDACLASGLMSGAYSYYQARCELWEAGLIPPEAWVDPKTPPFDSIRFSADEEKALWNGGIKSLQKIYPNCPIKLIPVLSGAPFQASRTPKQLVAACEDSDEIFDACVATGYRVGSYYYYRARCELWKSGLIPQKVWAELKTPPLDSFFLNAEEMKALWNEGITKLPLQKHFPNCPVKPIP